MHQTNQPDAATFRDVSRDQPVTIIGGGLAGTEAAWQLASRGRHVRLIEMRPCTTTPAHQGSDLAELVCSNSFKSDDPDTAAGLLKTELEALGSVVLAAAHATRVPAGTALAVDRARFASLLTDIVGRHPGVTLVREEASTVPEGPTILATGPLTSAALEPALEQILGSKRLAFFDAAAPIIAAESIDRTRVFAASRYDKGGGAHYLNAPLDREEYAAFVRELVAAGRVLPKAFERGDLFAACQPVEEVARTGPDALRFGPLKPVGLVDPATETRPWAVVQLRPENAAGTAFNLVGFQTNLTFPEQERVFRMIPGLAHADFLRLGVMHRNTFIDAPRLLSTTLALLDHPQIWMAGQLIGTEGYLEAAATGLLAGLNAFASLEQLEPVVLPTSCALGSLVAYATDPRTTNYQPMHVNFGLVPPLDPPVRGKRARYKAYSKRARHELDDYLAGRPDLRLAPLRQETEEAVRG